MAGSRNVARSWQLFDRARDLIPAGTGTGSKAATARGAEPAYITRGEGCRVWDLDGNAYIDFRNGLGPVTLGYGFKPVHDAITAQLANGIVFGHPHPLELELAEQLTAVIPGAEMVRYLKTGGEAISAVFKLARAYTGRETILTCGYHGWLNLTEGKGVTQATTRHHPTYPYGDIDAVRTLLQEHQGHVAAVSIAGSYAHMTPRDAFPAQLRELTERHNVLLIVDEIVTGFRLRIGGFHEYYGFTPDLAVFSKGMANGMPISAYVGRADVMRMVEQGATISSTFSGETLSLAAALATVRTYRNEGVIDHLWRIGERWVEGMRRVFADRKLPGTVNGLPPCPMIDFDTGDAARDALYTKALIRGLYTHGVSTYRVSYVNFAHSPDDIDEALAAFDRTCCELDEHLKAVDPNAPATPAIGVDAFH